MSIVYNWKEESSGTFGTIKKPIAEIKIQDTNKEWKRFVFKVDSGATITVMNAEDCEFLGLKMDDGMRVLLSPAGSNPIYGRIHHVSMMIGTKILENVRIAFSETPIRELLLGRLEVFDAFYLEFRGRLGKTTFNHES